MAAGIHGAAGSRTAPGSRSGRGGPQDAEVVAVQAKAAEPDSGVTWDIFGTFISELRVFPDDPEFPGQKQDTVTPSFAVQPELTVTWNQGDDQLTFMPFGRWDGSDERRSHFDVREANWLHAGDGWDILLGNDIVFWGTTESRHLVDIINQVDQVEDIDEEDRLGQPMVNLNLLFGEYGRLGAFFMPLFRTRTFPGDDDRLRGPFPIDEDGANFDADGNRLHPDFAVRYDTTVGPADLGVAHFYGTSREPRLVLAAKPGGVFTLEPFYDLIHQTSIDAQANVGDTLLKLEALTRSGQGDRFYAVVGGFEHMLFDLFNSGADLGLLAEYLGDSRDSDDAPATSFENDVFVGTRLTLNDVDDTNILAGAVIDIDDQATAISIEAERRLTDAIKLAIEGRVFVNVPPLDVGDLSGAGGLSGIRSDSFIQTRLSVFF